MATRLGDVGAHFLFENEHVKVWSLVLEPGESSPWQPTHDDTTCSSLTSRVPLERTTTMAPLKNRSTSWARW